MDDSPIAYWRLDETTGATTAADQTSSHDGTYQNGVALEQAGIFTNNDAAAFDDVDDYISVPDHTALRPAQLSVEAWVFADSDIDDYDTALAKTSGWSNGYGLYHSGGNLVFFVNHYTNHKVEWPVPTNRWTHAVGSYDGSDIKLYINGNLVATTP